MDLYVTNTDVYKRKMDSVEDVPHEGKVVVNGGENELKPLLSPQKRSQRLKWTRTSRRKVQWSDRKGENLVEVLEFHPSETSDSEDGDGSGCCVCTIM